MLYTANTEGNMRQEVTKMIPRPEHPRPDFMRDTFLNLNGQWAFEFDDEDIGIQQGWYHPAHCLGAKITVPFCYQCAASGIGPTDEIHPIMWYRRKFYIPMEMQNRRVLLRFGAVDYEAVVYINGYAVGSHKGGYTPFALDVTDYLVDGENDVCVRVVDRPDPTQPRGKQNWQRGVFGCWYTPVSGIWQTVYLEAVSDIYIDYIHVTPDVDRRIASVEVMLNQQPREKVLLQLMVSLDGREIREVCASTKDRSITIPIDVTTQWTDHPVALWNPGEPNLYDLRIYVTQNDQEKDRVDTYFGMRKIELYNGQIYLNDGRLYQRLVLDQGYWPDTLLTPPSDEAIRKDLEWTLKLGYNGARKHQKIEDPRYYYWADKMGVLIWGEIPSPYKYTDETVENLTATVLEFIRRDFNHPSIIAWVTLNESWGVKNIAKDQRQQMTAAMLYYLTKAADNTRLCSGNDGWEQVKTDICALHDYADTSQKLRIHFGSREKVEKNGCDLRRCYAENCHPSGEEAFMVTEYGGIAFSNIGLQGNVDGTETWGYHGKVNNEEEFFRRFHDVTNAILELPYNQGFCYTQLTDVMQEVNGLLTPDRKVKVDSERIAVINQMLLKR